MPIAPNPALSLPPMLIKSKKGKSVGFEGTGLSFPFQRTKRGASGSPNTRSSFKPLSSCKQTWYDRCTMSSSKPGMTRNRILEEVLLITITNNVDAMKTK